MRKSVEDDVLEDDHHRRSALFRPPPRRARRAGHRRFPDALCGTRPSLALPARHGGDDRSRAHSPSKSRAGFSIADDGNADKARCAGARSCRWRCSIGALGSEQYLGGLVPLRNVPLAALAALCRRTACSSWPFIFRRQPRPGQHCCFCRWRQLAISDERTLSASFMRASNMAGGKAFHELLDGSFQQAGSDFLTEDHCRHTPVIACDQRPMGPFSASRSPDLTRLSR